ncbi:helix-turn-helix domain-containing protein [Streptomyces niveus]
MVELGKFLTARRGAVTPSQVGLPEGTRRKPRKPGLRREEVAMLAGVGFSWYQHIEQGRANASREILEAVSGVLGLDPIEHRYMMGLAGITDRAPVASSSDGVLVPQIVRGYLPNPAYVVDRCWNVVSANSAALRLFGVPFDGGNYLSLLFNQPRFRELFADWHQEAADAVARFRAHSGNLVEDVDVAALIRELSMESPEFTSLWEARDVSDGSCTEQAMRHDELGEVSFTRVTLDFTCERGLRMFLLTPDAQTAKAIDARWEAPVRTSMEQILVSA